MTFEKLCGIIEKYDIPHTVKLLSDSGWECDATHINGVFYCEKYNVIVFTQDDGFVKDEYLDQSVWKNISE